MIEHADAALEAWLSTLDPPVDVTLRAPHRRRRQRSRVRRSGRCCRSCSPACASRLNKRDNQITDLRSDDGRVVGRQAATRFFELDYLCTVGGPARDAHRALGDLLQLLVDHDVVPSSTCPRSCGALGYPIDAMLVSSDQPASRRSRCGSCSRCSRHPSVDIGPPVTSLHLDMAPPPEPASRAARPALRHRRRGGESRRSGRCPEKQVDDGAPARADRAVSSARRRPPKRPPPSRSRRARAAERWRSRSRPERCYDVLVRVVARAR